ncbi:D-2-hydroxyacid dehydrogenase [Poseidonocella sp. HB161398]|uniref:D-2-hydroxyacid dehydrogenase n=1 Tax=Poseidonocella sp. HB161398 TaxID=2320855 RepID=UPI0011085E54|nr:D-2-hydroxyacid dehydrogenase [Poseidonocella sp. HB161398]
MTRLHVLNAPGALTFDEDALRRRLAEAGGLDVTISHDLARLADEIGEAEILYTNTKTDLGTLRARAPALKWVQIISAGVETLLPTLPADLILTNASGVHAEKGGEFVLASVLLLNYRIPAFQERQRRHEWVQDFVRPLRGKRAVVLGSGAIGGEAIRLLAGRGMEVIAVNRSGRAAEGAASTVTIEELDEVLARASVLVSALPATGGTEGLIDARRLALLPAGTGVVSVGRAAVFDHDALCAALHSGHLGGAVLDVFPVEPIPADDPTWGVPGLVVTPHCSVDDNKGYLDRCTDIFLQNLAARRAGEPMPTRVDPAAGY